MHMVLGRVLIFNDYPKGFALTTIALYNEINNIHFYAGIN